ncbi:MAG: hypothetical protein PHT40_01250 [Patescibacteria group bacterium]|nr:hypothetical protein [Patescibacteria group bacterium]
MAKTLCWSEELNQQLYALKRAFREEMNNLENKFRSDREILIKNAVEGVKDKRFLIINKDSGLHGEKVKITGFDKPFASDSDSCSIALSVSRCETHALESRMATIIIPGTELHLIDVEENKKEEKITNTPKNYPSWF